MRFRVKMPCLSGKENNKIAGKILPGKTITVDGIILSGNTSINQAVMAGESLPVDKGTGDNVCSGTVNQFGSFDMKAVKVGEDSSIQRMICLVQSTDAGKAKIVSLADRWATWIVVITLTAAALTWIASGQIIRAVQSLLYSVPAPLSLSASPIPKFTVVVVFPVLLHIRSGPC